MGARDVISAPPRKPRLRLGQGVLLAVEQLAGGADPGVWADAAGHRTDLLLTGRLEVRVLSLEPSGWARRIRRTRGSRAVRSPHDLLRARRIPLRIVSPGGRFDMSVPFAPGYRPLT